MIGLASGHQPDDGLRRIVLDYWARAGNVIDGDRPDPGGPAPSGTNPQSNHYEQNDHGIAPRVLRFLSGTVHTPKPGPTLLLGPVSRASLESPTPTPISQALRCLWRADVQCKVLFTQVSLRAPGATDQALCRVRPTAERQATRGTILLPTLQSQALGPAPFLRPRNPVLEQTENSAVGTPGNRARSVRGPNPRPRHRPCAQRGFSGVKPNPLHSFCANGCDGISLFHGQLPVLQSLARLRVHPWNPCL